MKPGVRDVRSVLMALLLFPAAPAMAQEKIDLSCEPRAFHVVAGQPVRVELTVRADSASPIRLHVPADPSLVLRAVEKSPVRLTREGVIVHKRVVIWQALKPGTVKLDSLSVESRGRKLLFPEITVHVGEIGP